MLVCFGTSGEVQERPVDLHVSRTVSEMLVLSLKFNFSAFVLCLLWAFWWDVESQLQVVFGIARLAEGKVNVLVPKVHRELFEGWREKRNRLVLVERPCEKNQQGVSVLFTKLLLAVGKLGVSLRSDKIPRR